MGYGLTPDLARCGECQRWASVPEGTALPIGCKLERMEGGNWKVWYPDGTELPTQPSLCGACGSPMVKVDMTAHYAALPVRADAPDDIAKLAAQKAKKGESK